MDVLWKILGGVGTFLLVACITLIANMWSSVTGLETWRDSIFPLEKSALQVEHAAFKLQFEIHDMELADHEREIEDLEDELRLYERQP